MPVADPVRSIVFEGDFRDLNDLIGASSTPLIYADPPFGTGRGFDTYRDVDHRTFATLICDLLVFSEKALAKGGTLWIHGSLESSDRVRKIVDEYPRARRVSSVMWERIYTPKTNALGLSNVLDEIVIVSFSDKVHFAPLPFDDDSRNLHRSWDEDPQAWISGDFSAPRADESPQDVFGIQNPMTGKWCYPSRGRRWSRGASSVAALLEQWAPGVSAIELDDRARRIAIAGSNAPQHCPGLGWIDHQDAQRTALDRQAAGVWPELFFGRTGRGGPRVKRYQDAPGKIASTLWRGRDVGWIQDARADIAAAVPGAHGFSTPKPERLLRRIIEMTTMPGDLVVDPFAGSGTTAVVAHALGRRFATAETQRDVIETYILPRLEHVDAGHHTWGDVALVRQLPFKVRRGEPTRAAEVLASLEADSRLTDVSAETLRTIRAALRRSDDVAPLRCSVPHRAPYDVVRRTMR